MGALADVVLLIVGLLVGWVAYRRALSTAWSRVGPTLPQTAYREAPTVAIPGAGRAVRLLVAYVYMLAYLGAARVAFGWIAMQEIYDRGHERSHLVPTDDAGSVSQLGIAVQGAVMFVLAPRMARALAHRYARNVPPILWTLLIGVMFALADIVLLYQSTTKPLLYWLRGLLVDDAAYAVFSLLGLGAVVWVDRLEKQAPADPSPASSPRTISVLEAIGVVVAFASIVSSLLYARQRYRVDQMITGEIDTSLDGSPSKGQDECYAKFWMPDGATRARERLPNRSDLRDDRRRTTYSFASPTTKLKLECWYQLSDDPTPFATQCPKDFVMTSDHTCERSAPDEDDAYDRVVQNQYVLYRLHVTNAHGAIANKFVQTFEPLPFYK
jgi:hypothetical protein